MLFIIAAILGGAISLMLEAILAIANYNFFKQTQAKIQLNQDNSLQSQQDEEEQNQKKSQNILWTGLFFLVTLAYIILRIK